MNTANFSPNYAIEKAQRSRTALLDALSTVDNLLIELRRPFVDPVTAEVQGSTAIATLNNARRDVLKVCWQYAGTPMEFEDWIDSTDKRGLKRLTP